MEEKLSSSKFHPRMALGGRVSYVYACVRLYMCMNICVYVCVCMLVPVCVCVDTLYLAGYISLFDPV